MLQSAQPVYIGWGPRLISLYNDGYLDFLGSSHPDALGKPYIEIWPELWDEYKPVIDAILRGEARYFVDQPIPIKGRPHRPMSWFTFSWTPLRADGGDVAGFFCVASETTDRVLAEQSRSKKAEAELRAAHDTFRHLVEHSPFGIYTVNADFRLTQVSDGARKVFQHVKPLIGRDFAEVLRTIWAEPFATEAIEHFRHTLRTGETYHAPSTVEHRADVEIVEAYDWKIERITLPDGRPGVVCHFYDLSERQRAEEHQAMLMAELDHRVKNTLAVVQAMAQQSLRSTDQEAAKRFTGRVAALARAHTLLADSRWQGASLRRLVEEAVAPHRVDGDPQDGRLSTSGADVRLDPKAAQALSLMLHEMATNAAKYGALSAIEGRISVDWEVRPASGGEPWLVLRWEEKGGPSIETFPQRKGFGTRLMETSAAYEMQGSMEFDYRKSGLRASLEVPLAKVISGSAAPVVTARPHRSARAGLSPSLEGLRVLVVEDQHLIASHVGNVLREGGCEIIGPAPTLARARSLAEAEQIDAAVLDINLGGEMVWPVAELLQARGIPFLCATGYADTIRPPAGLPLPPRVGKPIDDAELRLALVSLLQDHATH